MTVPVRVSEHDLLGLLSIVSDHRADDPGDGLPLSLFEHLMQQVPCDEISFFGLDSQQQAVWFGQGIPATGDGDMDAFWTTSGTPCRVLIPSAPVTCAASRGPRISTAPASGTRPACTATTCGQPGTITKSCCAFRAGRDARCG
jgi:hypothetical protein